MARVCYSLQSGERALTSGTRYGLIGCNGPSSYLRAVLRRFAASLKGGSPTSAMVNLRLCYTNAQAISGGTSVNPNYRRKSDGSNLANAQLTGYYGFTVPTSSVQVIHEALWHPQAGMWEPFPFQRDEEPDLVYGTNCIWIDALSSEAGISADGQLLFED